MNKKKFDSFFKDYKIGGFYFVKFNIYFKNGKIKMFYYNNLSNDKKYFFYCDMNKKGNFCFRKIKYKDMKKIEILTGNKKSLG